jgi:hypothetical protein
MIGVSANDGAISPLFCFVLLFALLFRSGFITNTNLLYEGVQKNNLYVFFLLTTFFALLKNYYLFRFLPLAVFNKHIAFAVVYLMLFVVFCTLVSIKRDKVPNFLSPIKYAMHMASVQIGICLISESTEKIQNISLILVNYILGVVGLFLLSIIRERVSERVLTLLNVMFFYFVSSLIGIPGTLGFYNHYAVSLIALKEYNLIIFIVYFLLSVFGTLILIKVGHFFILGIKQSVGMEIASERRSEFYWFKTTFTVAMIVFFSVFIFNIGPTLIEKIIPVI